MAGAEHPLVKKILSRQVARRPGRRTGARHQAQPGQRTQEDWPKAAKTPSSCHDDPMIALAKLVDAEARKVSQDLRREGRRTQRQAYAKIAKARFAVEGTGIYPDATFTLRLAFGQVKGYEEDGKQVPPYTTIGGAFERSQGPRRQRSLRAAPKAGSRPRTS